MVDKKLKIEKKMNKSFVVRRVESYGYGKYGDKNNAVCYWTHEGGNFVSYEPNKLQMFYRTLKWKAYYYIRIRFLEDFLNIKRKFKYSKHVRAMLLEGE
jgi:hypothetical protein